jgi:3-oxoacyl-[acyl-carrier protein] reductase
LVTAEVKVVNHRRDLCGKIAIVTGGGTGIGAEVSIRLAEAGAAVAINYLDTRESAERVVENIRQTGGTAIAVQGDMSRQREVRRLKEVVDSTLGTCDILVNNAGIYPRISWSNLREEDWDHLLNINLKAHFLCTKALTEGMQAKGYGKIINVGSVLALAGRHELVPYIAAKAGVIGLTRALARELGKYNICVNCVLPGSIYVEREREVVEDPLAAEKRQLERQCLQRRGTVADVGGVFVFLASRDSDFITGQSICVDGGWIFN